VTSGPTARDRTRRSTEGPPRFPHNPLPSDCAAPGEGWAEGPSRRDAQAPFRRPARSERLPRGWGGCRLPPQRPTQWRPRPRSPHTVRRWSARRPKMANTARRRPTSKVLMRIGSSAIDTYRIVVPSLFCRDDVHRYTPTPWPPILRASKPSAVETCAYTFAALATAKAARPATSCDLPASCAHQLRNSGELPTHFLPSLLRTGNRYEPAERASVSVRRSTIESDLGGSKKTSRRQVDPAISAHCNN
jgi:hypothetical protein